MKKITAIILSLTLVFCLFTGCGKSNNNDIEATDAPAPTEEPVSEPSFVPSTGIFKIESAEAGTLSYEAHASFNEATNDLDGISYTPLACLGTQAVSGKNYLILAVAKSVLTSAAPSLKVLTIYKPIGEDAKISKISDFNADNYINSGFNNNIDSKISAGSYMVDREGNMDNTSKEFRDLLANAFGKYTGLKLEALACLGTQIVAGTNYALVCRGTSIEDESLSALFIAVMYVDFSNEAVITSVCPVDLTNL